jgi:hypothetical protein
MIADVEICFVGAKECSIILAKQLSRSVDKVEGKNFVTNCYSFAAIMTWSELIHILTKCG